ncbi:PREDICTED: uncharacterized protein LOC109191221 [Ipomoea nil]|uniref:uncharacterized protein LOC109191221 n=1 Tax=Ipomoea nil TaxID=35883 RepID=UPI00090175DC|nr:PREDICTED: uncharacterized protein LOC109191221 [Ipomoea nil]
MRDFPSCFGESGVQVADSSSSSGSSGRAAQNLVTCVYLCELRGVSRFITVTWTKNLMGQGLLIGVENPTGESLCKVDIKPSLFSKRKGSKNAELGSSAVEVYWDFSNAKFGSSPEPLEGFYLAVTLNQELILLTGDLQKLAYKKIDAAVTIPAACTTTFLAKREHISGKKLYAAKAQLSDKGALHDISIECDDSGHGSSSSDPCLVIRVDGQPVMQVRQLRWKFRGNHTILVDGNLVQVLWDVHDWLFGNTAAAANGVFLFQTSSSCSSSDKLWSSQLAFNCSEFQHSQPSCSKAQGFSLLLYVWKD